MQITYLMGTRFTKEDIRTPDEDGITPMYIAAQKNTVEALQWLFDHGAQEDVLHIRGIQEIIGEFVRGISKTRSLWYHIVQTGPGDESEDEEEEDEEG